MSHEGTYTIQRNQMNVKAPKNIADDDLVPGKEITEQPISQLTSVSYLLQRIRLAEVGRVMIDLTREETGYSRILAIHDQLQNFIRDVPAFLLLDRPEIMKLPQSDPRCSTHVAMQRYTLNLLYHRQICELHVPYLTRGAVDEAYAQSRDACVSSARTIVNIYRRLTTEPISMPYRLKMNMVSRSMLIAAVVFVLNACLDEDANSKPTNHAELLDALKCLNETRNLTSIAGKLLEVSMQVFRAHNVILPDLEMSKLNPVMASQLPQSEMLPPTPDSDFVNNRRTPGYQQMTQNPEMGLLEDHWQVLDGGLDLNSIDWERLISGLDAPVM